MNPPATILKPGSVLGRYELLMPIAQGGMAKVWAACQRGSRGFQKTVAIKTMTPPQGEEALFEAMFLAEAALASRVNHPHVAQILDLGETKHTPFLVMEWVDGVPLSQLLRASSAHGGVPLPIAVHMLQQAAAGLHAAHELTDEHGTLLGLVHRDISPQNVLVTFSGVVKIVDFGIAKLTSREDGNTRPGEIKGKLSYMSPEQLQCGAIDRRADVFSLGALAYCLTTGRKPFAGNNAGDTVRQICSPDAPESPCSFVPGYPRDLEHVVLRALAKEREQRYETADAMLRALTQLSPALTASTDEDVGQYVRATCGEARDNRNDALDSARRDAEARERGKARVGPATSEQGAHISTGEYSATVPRSELMKRSFWSARSRVRAAVGIGLCAALALLGAKAVGWGGLASVAEQTPTSAHAAGDLATSRANTEPYPAAAQEHTEALAKTDVQRDLAEPILDSATDVTDSVATGSASDLTANAGLQAVGKPRATNTQSQLRPSRPPSTPSTRPPEKRRRTSWKHDPGF